MPKTSLKPAIRYQIWMYMPLNHSLFVLFLALLSYVPLWEVFCCHIGWILASKIKGHYQRIRTSKRIILDLSHQERRLTDYAFTCTELVVHH